MPTAGIQVREPQTVIHRLNALSKLVQTWARLPGGKLNK